MAALTPSFQDAIAKAATLSPAEQDALAALILAEIQDEQQWDELLRDSRSPVLLERLAASALAEDKAGLTESLDDLLTDGIARRRRGD
jgi:hypothetical protein